MYARELDWYWEKDVVERQLYASALLASQAKWLRQPSAQCVLRYALQHIFIVCLCKVVVFVSPAKEGSWLNHSPFSELAGSD